MTYPTNNDDVIDSRDVIEAIESLQHDLVNNGNEVADQDALDALVKLAEEASDYAEDWQYGVTLIRDSYFEDYARELADDIGAINHEAGWPLTYIDWEAAAAALQMDYTSVDFDGVTYWVR